MSMEKVTQKRGIAFIIEISGIPTPNNSHKKKEKNINLPKICWQSSRNGS